MIGAPRLPPTLGSAARAAARFLASCRAKSARLHIHAPRPRARAHAQGRGWRAHPRVMRHRQLRQAIWSAHFRWPLYRHWSTLPDDVLVRILDELWQVARLSWRSAGRAGSQWTQVVQRTVRWKAMWKRVRESPRLAAAVLRPPVGAEYVRHAAQRQAEPHREARHTAPGHLGGERFTLTEDVLIIYREVEAQLRRFTVVVSARLYNKKTGRAYDLQEDSGCIGIKGPIEVETNRRSGRGEKEFEYRWCLDRGPLLKNVHVIEYLQDLGGFYPLLL